MFALALVWVYAEGSLIVSCRWRTEQLWRWKSFHIPFGFATIDWDKCHRQPRAFNVCLGGRHGWLWQHKLFFVGSHDVNAYRFNWWRWCQCQRLCDVRVPKLKWTNRECEYTLIQRHFETNNNSKFGIAELKCHHKVNQLNCEKIVSRERARSTSLVRLAMPKPKLYGTEPIQHSYNQRTRTMGTVIIVLCVPSSSPSPSPSWYSRNRPQNSFTHWPRWIFCQ